MSSVTMISGSSEFFQTSDDEVEEEEDMDIGNGEEEEFELVDLEIGQEESGQVSSTEGEGDEVEEIEQVSAEDEGDEVEESGQVSGDGEEEEIEEVVDPVSGIGSVSSISPDRSEVEDVEDERRDGNDDDNDDGADGASSTGYGLVSSQRSRTSFANDDGNISLSMFKTGELALVWYVGNGEFSSFSTTKIKNVKKAILEVDLDDLCNAVSRIYPEVMICASAASNRKKNVGLIHIAFLLKGLAVIIHTQLLSCKRSITAEYEKLTKPAQIDLPTTPSKPKKARKPGITPTTPAGEEVNFGLNEADSTNGTGVLPTPRRAGGPQDSESDEADPVDILEAHRRGERRPRHKKGLNEKDIMSLLEKRANELRHNGQGVTLIGNGVDLPDEPAPRNDFMDSCPHEELNRFDEGPCPIGRDEIEKSPPRNRKQRHGEDAPVAPRKRARMISPSESEIMESSLVLNSLESVSQNTKVLRKRQLLFTGIDNKIAITMEEMLKAQKPLLGLVETRKLVDGLLVRTKFTSLLYPKGLKMIESSGRLFISDRLKKQFQENLMSCRKLGIKRAQILRRALNVSPDQSVHDENEGRLNRSEETHAPIEASGQIGGDDIGIVFDIVPPDVNAQANDADFMIPVQADPMSSQDSLDRQNMEQPHTSPETFDRSQKSLSQIAGQGANRRKIAHVFGILLKMQGQRKILLTQVVAYGSIMIQQLEKRVLKC